MALTCKVKQEVLCQNDICIPYCCPLGQFVAAGSQQCQDFGLYPDENWSPFESDALEIFLNGGLEDCSNPLPFNFTDLKSSYGENVFTSEGHLDLAGVIFKWNKYCIDQVFTGDNFVQVNDSWLIQGSPNITIHVCGDLFTECSGKVGLNHNYFNDCALVQPKVLSKMLFVCRKLWSMELFGKFENQAMSILDISIFLYWSTCPLNSNPKIQFVSLVDDWSHFDATHSQNHSFCAKNFNPL